LGFISTVKSLFGKKDNKQYQYAKMMNGYAPIFSQFGTNIYASDVVQMCIDCIASEISKLQPRHIRTAKGIQTTVNSSINRLFKFKPNELMTTKDFLEKITWLLYMNYNCFIYPTYDLIPDKRGGYTRYYTGFYPLNPTQVDFLQDESNALFVKFYFNSGQNFTLAYSDVIHLRKKYSVNDVMGGGLTGQPDNAALLKVLEINDTVLQGIGKAIKTSLSVRGVMKINTMLDGDRMQKERDRFEAALESGASSILPLDLKSEYTPITVDPKLIDKDTMEFLDNKILRYMGVSLPILSGDYTDEQYQAFYEKTLEPILIGAHQAFSVGVFTTRELDMGNEIVMYFKNMMYLSTASKLKLLESAGAQGLLTDDQKLAIIGYPPLEDGTGSRRTMSLNYVDTQIANEYQMTRANAPQINSTNDSAGGSRSQSYIRSKNSDELDKVRQVIKSLTKAEKKELGPRYFYDDAQYRDFKMDGDKTVAFLENRITGKKGHLNVAVNSDYRGKGYAEKLIKKAIKKAPDLGVEKMYWITTPGNDASRKLAEKLGFTLNKEKDDEVSYIYDLLE